MRKLWRKRWFGVSAFVIAGVLLALLGLCWYFRIWGPRQVIAYYCLMQETEGFDPVWKDLALRRFGKDDNVRALQLSHPPYSIVPIGRYTMLDYVSRGDDLSGNSLYVVAKDGRLLFAHAIGHLWPQGVRRLSGVPYTRPGNGPSYIWDHVFFGDRRDVEAFSTHYQDYLAGETQKQAEVR